MTMTMLMTMMIIWSIGPLGTLGGPRGPGDAPPEVATLARSSFDGPTKVVLYVNVTTTIGAASRASMWALGQAPKPGDTEWVRETGGGMVGYL